MKRKKLLQIITLCTMISVLLISCGGGNDETKPAKTKASGSAFDKMISMATTSASELQKIQEKAQTETNINKLTKLAEDLAKKESELSTKFIDYVSKQTGSLNLPVEQSIYEEFFSVGPIQILSAESLEKIIMKVDIKALKTPFPTIDDRVYLKLVDKDGKLTQKLLAPKPFGKKDITEWDWSPFMSISIFKGAVKAVVISEEEFKQK